ncbi:hypothetical protein B296_00042199 [Ensete ventricosum]|uniref:Uncharacterized protein n=1 Tax=Ensete ventricosum TaxID=4639 RepID=A0A426YSX7_ENSVE|nr:hypothetical protein B296_00042199 [Ensete ventricosum]
MLDRLHGFSDVVASPLPPGSLLLGCPEVLQKTRAEHFGLGRVPSTLKSGASPPGLKIRPPKMIWGLSGSVVRRSATVPTPTLRSLQVEGAGLVHWLCYTSPLARGMVGRHRAVKGYPEVRSGGRRWVDVAES